MASTPFTASSNAPSCRPPANISRDAKRADGTGTYLGDIRYDDEVELVAVRNEELGEMGAFVGRTHRTPHAEATLQKSANDQVGRGPDLYPSASSIPGAVGWPSHRVWEPK
jgi:hypothetical protein